jgi:hypothetical protein
VKYALNYAYDLGVTYSFLGASDDGVPVYKKLGFEVLSDICAFQMK